MTNTVTKLTAEQTAEAINLRARLKATQGTPQHNKDSVVAANDATVDRGDDHVTQQRLSSLPGEDIATALGLLLVKDQHGKPRAQYMRGMRLSTPPINSREIDDLVTECWLSRHGDKGLKPGVELTMTKLRLAAQKSTTKVHLYVRTALRTLPDGTTQQILDLGRADGQVVVSDRHGWSFAHNTDIAFAEPDGECALPHRFDSPQSAYAYLEGWLGSSGVDESQKLPLVAALASTLRRDVAYMVIDLNGPAGSGKTTLVNDFSQSVDPSGNGLLVQTPPNHKDIAATSTKRLIIAIDNVSGLSRELQNLCCQIVYGFVHSERELYSNHNVASVTIKCPVFTTGVNPSVTATDLLTRTLRITLAARKNYRRNKQDSKDLRSKILGALLELLVAGLRHEETDPDVETRHRMADVVLFGEGIAKALGHEAGYFTKLFSESKKRSASDYAAGDPLVFSLVRFLRSQESVAVESDKPPSGAEIRKNRGFIIRQSSGKYVAGYTPLRLVEGVMDAFNKKPTDAGFSWHAGDSLPTNGRAMSVAMNRVMSSILVELGYQAEKRYLGSPKNNETLFLFGWKPDEE